MNTILRLPPSLNAIFSKSSLVSAIARLPPTSLQSSPTAQELRFSCRRYRPGISCLTIVEQYFPQSFGSHLLSETSHIRRLKNSLHRHRLRLQQPLLGDPRYLRHHWTSLLRPRHIPYGQNHRHSHAVFCHPGHHLV